MASGSRPRRGLALCWHGHLPGDGPPAGDAFPRDGHHHLMRGFTPGAQLAVAFAPPPVGLPTDSLQRFRPRVESPLEMAADLRRRARGPGPCDPRSPGMGVARVSEASLATSVSTSVFRGDEPEITQERSGVVNTGEVAQCCPEGNGPRALDAA
jgi:hypothetical protein